MDVGLKEDLVAGEVSVGEWVEVSTKLGIVVSKTNVGNLEGATATAVGKVGVCEGGEGGTIVASRRTVGSGDGSEVGVSVGLTVGGRGGRVTVVDHHGSVSSVCMFAVFWYWEEIN